MAKEYIERESVVAFLENMAASRYLIQCFEDNEKFPAADVVEVKHGEWIKPTPCSQEYCNQCGLTPKMVFGILPNYCPHCGAKMDGGNK